MKKTITIITTLLSVISTLSFGQCISKVDEMTNDKIISNELVKIGKRPSEGMSPMYYFKMSVSKVNQITILNFYSERGSLSSIKENDIIYLKTQDSVLKVFNYKYQITNVTSGEAFTQGTNNSIYYYTISVPIDEATLLYLKMHPLVKVRVDNYDYEVNKPKLLIEQINCILNNR